MKIKEGFVLRDVCGEHIIVSEGLQNIDFSKLINLNESAACMWQAAMDKDFTVDDLVNALTAEYEVEEAQARTDVENVLKQWKELGLIAE